MTESDLQTPILLFLGVQLCLHCTYLHMHAYGKSASTNDWCITTIHLNNIYHPLIMKVSY